MNQQNTNEIEQATAAQKLKDQVEKIQKQLSGYSLADQLAMQDTKIIDCKHEIAIKVIANVYTQDDEKSIIDSIEICQKNYHIPVPAKKNYHEYLKGFFDHLENCMSTSATKMEGDHE